MGAHKNRSGNLSTSTNSVQSNLQQVPRRRGKERKNGNTVLEAVAICDCKEAKAEVMQFKALAKSYGRVSEKYENGMSVAEIFASFGTAQHSETLQLAPNF